MKLAGCHDPGISDHHLIFAVVNLRRQKSSPVIKEVTDFKNVNCELLRQDLNYAPWSICGIFDDIDDVDFWRVVREMQGKAKPSVGAIRNENENIIINAKDKAESFNKFFFSRVGEKLADVIIPDNSFNIFHHIYQVSPTIEPLKINSQKIKRAFDKCVKPGKGPGPDNLSARGLKLGGDAVAVGLSYVMEESSKTSSYPSQWKLSKVRAVPKKGNSSERGDFRPISLLNIPSKVYEGVIGEAIDCHFIDGGISSQSQWGFKSGRSTEFLMLHLTEAWRQELDKNRTVVILFIDFKKAFDSICHKTMALKLQASGMSGNLYNLIIDYLSGRKQYVEIEGQRSTEADVRFGVPQGSILGPRLFSIYVNDLSEVPSSGNLEMFADDTTFYCSGDSVDDVCANIQSSLEEIAKWCNRNYLTIHPEKIEVMLLTRINFIGPLRPIKLGDNVINFVSHSHSLGFNIDNLLNWGHHVKDLETSMAKKVKQLRRF